MNVVIKKCDDYTYEIVRKKIKESIDLLGGLASLIKPNAKVFIKCNCVGPFPKEKGITTHPIVLKAIISLLKEFTNDITVGDNPATKDQIFTLKKNGLYEIIQEEKVKVLNNKDLVTITNPNYKVYNEFEISKEMLDFDILINLPKLKTHSLTYITCAQKNLFGFIYGLNKSAWHVKASNPLQFGEAINDLYGALISNFKGRPILSICDGIIGLEGEGPSSGGIPINSKILLTSLDPVALDRVAVMKMGLDYKKAFINVIAGERGYGINDITKINILGDSIPNLNFLAPKDSLSIIGLRLVKFKPIRNFLFEHPRIDHNKCIKCGECARICPPKAMRKENTSFPHLKSNYCIRCWCCAEVCPVNAITKTNRPLIGKIIFKTDKK